MATTNSVTTINQTREPSNNRKENNVMARNTDIAQVSTSPNVTARLEWEKKDERGTLVFSDSRYEPISVEVEELKGTHQPIIRIIYYRGSTGVARYVRPKSGAPLNAQSVMAGVEVTPDRMRSVQRMIGLKKIFFYKTVSLIKNGPFNGHPEFKRLRTLADEIARWAFQVYEEYGVRHDEAAMCDYLAAEVARLDEMPQQPLVSQRNLRASITYQQFLKTPGLIDDLDAHDTVLYCHARDMSINFISFLLALPKEEVKDIITESRRAGKKPRSTGESGESKLYPTGTILVTSWSYERTTVAFWQVVRSTEKTLWVQQIRVTATVNTPAYKELLPVMPPEPVDDTVYQCRINLRFGRNTPICIQNARAYVWDGTPEQASGDYS